MSRKGRRAGRQETTSDSGPMASMPDDEMCLDNSLVLAMTGLQQGPEPTAGAPAPESVAPTPVGSALPKFFALAGDVQGPGVGAVGNDWEQRHRGLGDRTRDRDGELLPMQRGTSAHALRGGGGVLRRTTREGGTSSVAFTGSQLRVAHGGWSGMGAVTMGAGELGFDLSRRDTGGETPEGMPRSASGRVAYDNDGIHGLAVQRNGGQVGMRSDARGTTMSVGYRGPGGMSAQASLLVGEGTVGGAGSFRVPMGRHYLTGSGGGSHTEDQEQAGAADAGVRDALGGDALTFRSRDADTRDLGMGVGGKGFSLGLSEGRSEAKESVYHATVAALGMSPEEAEALPADQLKELLRSHAERRGLLRDDIRSVPYWELAVGEGVAVREEASSSVGAEVGFQAWSAGLGVRDGENIETTILHPDEETIRVILRVGDLDGGDAKLGAGVVGVSASRSDSETREVVFDCDLTSEAGQKELDAFLESGLLPGAEGSPEDHQLLETLEYGMQHMGAVMPEQLVMELTKARGRVNRDFMERDLEALDGDGVRYQQVSQGQVSRRSMGLDVLGLEVASDHDTHARQRTQRRGEDGAVKETHSLLEADDLQQTTARVGEDGSLTMSTMVDVDDDNRRLLSSLPGDQEAWVRERVAADDLDGLDMARVDVAMPEATARDLARRTFASAEEEEAYWRDLPTQADVALHMEVVLQQLLGGGDGSSVGHLSRVLRELPDEVLDQVEAVQSPEAFDRLPPEGRKALVALQVDRLTRSDANPWDVLPMVTRVEDATERNALLADVVQMMEQDAGDPTAVVAYVAKVDEVLREGGVDAGSREQQLAALARVSFVDEDAVELEQELKAAGGGTPEALLLAMRADLDAFAAAAAWRDGDVDDRLVRSLALLRGGSVEQVSEVLDAAALAGGQELVSRTVDAMLADDPRHGERLLSAVTDADRLRRLASRLEGTALEGLFRERVELLRRIAGLGR